MKSNYFFNYHSNSNSKYHAKRIETEDGSFDSKKEYERFLELKLLESAGVIKNLERQKKYMLIDAQYLDIQKGNKTARKLLEKPCIYIADFVYTEDNKEVVEDVKGYKKGQAYQLFVIKRKLMLYRYGIQIREV